MQQKQWTQGYRTEKLTQSPGDVVATVTAPRVICITYELLIPTDAKTVATE
jgi:hypothetical protein